MTTSGDVGAEIAPEVADDAQLAARLDDFLHRACSLARALTTRGRLATAVCGENGRGYGFLQLPDKSGGADLTAEDEDRIRELAAFTRATLDAL
jgi:hypothetical protein